MCFFENVEGHISLGLSTVISDLEELGYQVSWGIFSASEVGAPHQRKRVFILAYDQRQRVEELGRQIAVGSKLNTAGYAGQDPWPSRPGEPQHGWEPPRVVGNATTEGLSVSGRKRGSVGESRPKQESKRPDKATSDRGLADSIQRRSDGRPNGISGRLGQSSQDEAADGRRDEFKTQSPMGRYADGSASRMDYAELCVSCDNRTDELRLLGNGVVPATAERAFRILMAELQQG
jgi:DNA (cytosine-5)-methyltransferase 1